MAHIASEDQDETRSDLTPLIDLVFLLLVFFLLTTTFLAPELALDSLLPTDTGSRQESRLIDPPEAVVLTVVPAGLPDRGTPTDFAHAWRAPGPRAPVEVRAGRSRLALPVADQAVLDALGPFVATALASGDALTSEGPAPVEIACFSGLPWRYALWTYDAVRDTARQDGRERKVGFAPPAVAGDRVYGRELAALVHAR